MNESGQVDRAEFRWWRRPRASWFWFVALNALGGLFAFLLYHVATADLMGAILSVPMGLIPLGLLGVAWSDFAGGRVTIDRRTRTIEKCTTWLGVPLFDREWRFFEVQGVRVCSTFDAYPWEYFYVEIEVVEDEALSLWSAQRTPDIADARLTARRLQTQFGFAMLPEAIED